MAAGTAGRGERDLSPGRRHASERWPYVEAGSSLLAGWVGVREGSVVVLYGRLRVKVRVKVKARSMVKVRARVIYSYNGL